MTHGTTITELTDDGAGVDVTLSDGTSARWDLVVGFDGIGSPLRNRLYGTTYSPSTRASPTGGSPCRASRRSRAS